MKKQFFLLVFSTAILLFSITKSYAQTPFPCNNTLYLSNGTTLYEYSVSGVQTPLFTVGNVNALAYSTTGLLWAFDQTAQKVVIIGGDGSITAETIPDLPTGGADYNVGAIDTNGYYYLYNGQQGGRFYIIDTDPSRPATYGKLVDPNITGGVVPYDLDTRPTVGTPIYPLFPNQGNRRIISDWCINPNDGQLYTVTNANSYRPFRLISYNPITGQLTEHTTNEITGGGTGTGFKGNSSFGAIFIDTDGNFFVFGNTHGHLYSINPATSTATRLSTTAISSSNIDGANCILSNVMLPIKLVGFDAYKKGSVAELVWTTAVEQNNRGFAIERSADGRTWVNLGFVSSKAENGNSSQKLEYTFIDNAPFAGINYYRLKQADFDGKYEYSSVKVIRFGKENTINVYPNPVKDRITITGLTGTEQIRIYNTSGRLIYQQKADNGNMNISLHPLREGLYYVQVVGTDGRISSHHKMIKNN